MRIAEWWSKYATRRESGGDRGDGALGQPDGHLPETIPAPTRQAFDRQRQVIVLSLLLHSAGTMEEMLSTLAEKGPQVTGASIVYPLLLDKRREVLHAKPLEGNIIPALDTLSAALGIEAWELEFPLSGHGPRRSVLESGEVEATASLADLLEDVVGRPASEAAEQALEPKHVVLAPMLMDGEPLGLLVFMIAEQEFDQELLELLTGHATLALKNLIDLEEMGRFGEVDRVTWLHNRRHFTEAMEREIARAERYHRPFSIVFLDIDGFAAFNENYGPSLGDRLLRSVGMVLAESLTEPDVVARIDNDDFALMLPEVNRAAAVSVTASLMARLRQVTVFSGSGSPEPVTASAAIVCYPEDGTTTRELIAAATSALTQAKMEKAAPTRRWETPEIGYEPAHQAGLPPTPPDATAAL